MHARICRHHAVFLWNFAFALTAASWPLLGRAQSTTFMLDSPVELGSNLDRIGELEWSDTLGVSWDTGFSLGAIVGKKDAVVIPRIEIPIPLLPDIVIPELRADTRTGLRLQGNVAGGTGLEFYADFNASGLEPGAAFDFHPTIVDLPAQVPSGEFVQLKTNAGVVDNPAFTESQIDLPSFDAGMNFYFDMDLDSQIEYGLFPVVKYNSVPFNPDPIHVNQSLIKFGFDLDPKSNDGMGTPPNFVILEDTPFEERLGLLDNDASIYEKQISVEMSVEGEPFKRRLDIGSAELVNPFGTGDSILGPNERNLTIITETDESTIKYSYQTPLVRLGLDLDGIAAYLGTSALTGAGDSFTRIEEKFLDDQIGLTLDLIDIKYGPEIGFRETVEIKPDFDVTLHFDQTVAINNGGQVSLTDTYTGKWNDLPGIALLGDDPVGVSVDFDQVTGEQTKRSVFYLTDYLELTLFELEELNLFDTVSVSLPPLYQTRTSLLGSLLGEAELELTDDTETIAPFGGGGGILGTGNFTLTPAPSSKVYVAVNGANFSTNPAAWRKLGTDVAPDTLASRVLVVATGDDSAQLVGDLTPTSLVDPAAGLVQIQVAGLEIPLGSSFEQSGSRIWTLSRITNDGLYRFNGSSVQFNAPAVLTIGGGGEARFEGTSMSLTAPVVSHGPDHTLTMLGQGGSIIADQLINAGHIVIDNSIMTVLSATQRFTNTGDILITGQGDNRLTTRELANDGLLKVSGNARSMVVSHPDMFGQINIQSTTGTGRFVAEDGATLRFTHTVLLDTQDVEPNPVRFEATGGGTIRFDGPIRAFDAGVAELSVDETSTMILNGVEVKREDGKVSLVNKGVVEVMAGSNRFYYSPDIPYGPGEEPRIIGINLDNQGTIRIHSNASLGFKAEIANYQPGGATLGPGTWELIGAVPVNPVHNDNGQTFVQGRATLQIDIARIINEDTYLGRIDFGDTNGDGVPDGYSAEDYETQLAVSEANVLLSGATRFDYFNTIGENRGTFTLRNKNYFDTMEGLLNCGEIRVESQSQLSVAGNLVVDEGLVFVDATSTLTVGTNTIEVIGGNITVDRGAGPLNVNTPWVVREKWIGVDDEGNDIVREARVSYGDAYFPTIGPNADITVDGGQAVFEPLAGVNLIEGSLTLTGGNELHLAQSLTNQGTLQLENAGKLYVDGNMLTAGQLNVDADSYLDVAGSFTTMAGSIHLDGVIRASSLTVDEQTTLSGAGRFAGSVENHGTLSPGNSPGVFEVVRDYTQSEDATMEIEIAGFVGGGGFDRLQVGGTALLDGFLDLSLTDGFALRSGQLFTILTADEVVDGGLQLMGPAAEYFDMFVTPGSGGSVVLQFLGGDFPLTGDFNGDHLVDTADYTLWRNTLGDEVEPFSGADTDGDGMITQADYGDWKRHFGAALVAAAPLLSGDYNQDGVVNTADYTVWRDHFGQLVPLPNEDPESSPGEVTQADYDFWKAHFGDTAGAEFAATDADSNRASVPGPGTIALASLAATCLCHAPWRRRCDRSARD